MLEQMGAINGIHFGAQAHLPRAELPVHVVQGMSHGVDGVDNKLHLSLLLVVGVLPYSLLIWKNTDRTFRIASSRSTNAKWSLCVCPAHREP